MQEMARDPDNVVPAVIPEAPPLTGENFPPKGKPSQEKTFVTSRNV